jgi:hypothetical protein
LTNEPGSDHICQDIQQMVSEARLWQVEQLLVAVNALADQPMVIDLVGRDRVLVAARGAETATAVLAGFAGLRCRRATRHRH